MSLLTGIWLTDTSTTEFLFNEVWCHYALRIFLVLNINRRLSRENKILFEVKDILFVLVKK